MMYNTLKSLRFSCGNIIPIRIFVTLHNQRGFKSSILYKIGANSEIFSKIG